MKDTIITLTPPIDGVQYGISDEPIEEGDFYYLQSVTTKNMILKASEFKISSNCKKIHFSSNPKDLRFPYLVVPSKEQEAERAWLAFYEKWLSENSGVLTSEDKAKFIVGFNANPAKYTQEQMEKCFIAGRNSVFSSKSPTGVIEQQEYIQSLQPTVKAVRVEMEEIELKYRLSAISKQFNEEDFTKELHKSLEENPNHDVKTFRHQYADKLGIPKYKIKVEASSEHSQGVIKALEVIY